jgi:PKHD-type hydroxylase
MLTTKPFTAYNVTFPYIFWDDFIPEDELTVMENYFKSQPITTATVASSTPENPDGIIEKDIRDTAVSMVNADAENAWIFSRLLQLTDFVNSQFYNYDLLGFDYLQYTLYNTSGSHYSYHMDMIMDDKITGKLVLPRKLSFSLILSDSDEYEGGEFDIFLGDKNTVTPEQKRGRVIAFPSYILHRVRPVTKGVRKSLVFWACGPKFK